MSVCLPHTNEYQLTCCPIIHDIPSEINNATCFSVSDNCLLLINHGIDRLFLFDLSLSPLKPRDINWSNYTYGTIRDICWAKYINLFLILGEDAICSYCPIKNEIKMLLNSSSINDCFWSLTVLGCDTYILYRDDTLHRYCLPSWTLTHAWSRNELISINNTDKFIEQIRAHTSIGIIALLIRLKHHRQWRIDLYDRKMEKLYSGESIRMASAYPMVILQPFGQHGRWTLMNEDNVWIINSNGHFIERYPRRKTKELE